MNYTVRVYQNKKLAKRIETKKVRVFLTKIAAINWKPKKMKVYLRVNYGNDSYNDGEYTDKVEFGKALRAFREMER